MAAQRSTVFEALLTFEGSARRGDAQNLAEVWLRLRCTVETINHGNDTLARVSVVLVILQAGRLASITGVA